MSSFLLHLEGFHVQILSCTICLELVTAAQRLAADCHNITAQVYDLNHYPDLRERYQVMSVPCLVVDGGEQRSFGKKISHSRRNR